ncbi:MAG TPA: hypothetical protein VIH56_06340 [Candidatus Acidoferrales bacterium]
MEQRPAATRTLYRWDKENYDEAITVILAEDRFARRGWTEPFRPLRLR